MLGLGRHLGIALLLIMAAIVGITGFIAIAVWLVRRRSGNTKMAGTEPLT